MFVCVYFLALVYILFYFCSMYYHNLFGEIKIHNT